MSDTIMFSLVTNKKGPLTKTIRPDGEGGITKEATAQLYSGTCELVKTPVSEFGHYLRSVNKGQAICHGITGHSTPVDIVTTANFENQQDTVTRTKEFFQYLNGCGIGMFDHDPKPGQDAVTPDEFLENLCGICQEFKTIPTWCTPSTSSCIYDLDGNELTAMSAGWHLYFPFSPANKLPEFAYWLFKKFWIAGHGYIYISKAGSLLTRTLFDKSVFSPERLDFVAGANCIDCVQRLPDPVYRVGMEVVA